MVDAAFWEACWREGRTAFDQRAPNRWLVEHVARLGPGRGRRVLVPLCGKSIDLAFLAAHGFDVVGVELSRLAAAAFFADSGLEPVVDASGPVRLVASGIAIVVADIATLGPELGTFDAFYDRAAVVALTREQRTTYAEVITRLLAPGARGLVVAEEHAGTDGPPFSVDAPELDRLWPTFGRELLGSARLVSRPRAMERAYALTAA